MFKFFSLLEAGERIFPFWFSLLRNDKLREINYVTEL